MVLTVKNDKASQQEVRDDEQWLVSDMVQEPKDRT
jgi:hypothetical protein